MSLTNDERSTLVALELKKAQETYEEIAILTAANKWSGAANRLYYAVFHVLNALLVSQHSCTCHCHRTAFFCSSQNIFNTCFYITAWFLNSF